MTVGLPDELWMVVLQAGLDSGMDYREFCTCALVSRFFKRLSSADHFWEQLWQKDWPSTSSHDGANSRSALANQKAPFVASDMLKSVTAPHGADSKNGGCSKPDRRFGGGIWKASFRERFERDKARRVASHRRKVFRVQSQVALLEAEMVDLRGAVDSERTKWTTALQQIQQVENSERALVASKVWQPQAVATRHQQLLEQHPLDASAQLNALRQEAAICQAKGGNIATASAGLGCSYL
eukprot:jgi/Mesen1/1411/ME000130S00489